MHFHMLPDAIQREREALLRESISILESEGSREFSVHDLAGYPEPEELIIPVLNVPMLPDIVASNTDHSATTLAIVEVSTDLGEESCGRRWQSFARWAGEHNARLAIFVHPEDAQRAREIADHWHVDNKNVVTVPRTH
jgi:hypothetical protein